MFYGSERVREAHRRGYFVDDDGVSHGPRGPLAPRPDPNGYNTICLRIDGRPVTIAAHKLAAFGRFGESALTHEVRHLDGNPGNNRVGNLAVGTHSENMMDIPPDVRREKAIHAAASLRKHSDEVVASVRADRASGHTYDIIGRTYGLSKSTISYILNRAAY